MGENQFEELWRRHRPFLVDLAFRMLGNIGDAEDVVQEAYTRLFRIDAGEIDDVRGWLVVVVSRRCLDILRSAWVRHDGRGADPHIEESPDPGGTTDPADRITLDDNIRLALLVVVEKLSPAERAVFVLHDVFRYPFPEIAEMLGRSVGSCRQLASRARRRIDGGGPGGRARFQAEPAEQRRVAERFIAACAGGDLAALLILLDADVAGQADLGPGLGKAPIQVGRDRVAANLLRFFGDDGVTLVSQPMNGCPGILAFRDGALWALVVLEIEDGVINDIHATLNPLTLGPVSALVGAKSSLGSPFRP